MTDTRLTVTFSAPAKMSREAIASALARSKLTIKRVRFHVQGRPPLSPDIADEARDLRSGGLSYREIGRRLEVSAMTVSRWCA